MMLVLTSPGFGGIGGMGRAAFSCLANQPSLPPPHFFLDLGERVMIKNELIPATNPAGRATRMNLKELSMSRAGRSSTRTERACLVSISRIACRGFQGRGHALPIESVTFRRCGDALPIESVTFRRCGDALPIESVTFHLCGDALPIESVAFRRCGDALPIESVAFRHCGDALPIDSLNPSLCSGALQDDYFRHHLNINPMQNENRDLGLGNFMGRS